MELGVVVFATIAALILAAIFEPRRRLGDPASAARADDRLPAEEPSAATGLR
jgi:hypothetical protein